MHGECSVLGGEDCGMVRYGAVWRKASSTDGNALHRHSKWKFDRDDAKDRSHGGLW